MAITLRSLTLGKTAKKGGKTPFLVDAYSADVTGLETVKVDATPKDIYVEYMYIVCPSIGVGEWIKIQDDSTLLFQILAPAGGGIEWERSFRVPIKVDGALKIDSQNIDPLEIQVEGFVA